jgi:hypothetical protein
MDWRVQIRAVPRCRKCVNAVLLSADFAKSEISGAGDTRNDRSRLVEFLHLKQPSLVSCRHDGIERWRRNPSAPL